MSTFATPNSSQTNLKVVKTETKANGESIQLVRPYAQSTKSTDEIVGDLVNNFSYRTMPVKASESELSAVQQAFGSSLASELINTYDGSNLVSDSQQDLIGERYLAEQIKLIEQQQRDSSVMNKWSHLLYEGDSFNNYHQNSTEVVTTVKDSLDQNPIYLGSDPVPTQSGTSVGNSSQYFMQDEPKKSDENILNDILEMVRRNENKNRQEMEQEANKDKINEDLKRALENAQIKENYDWEREQEQERITDLRAQEEILRKSASGQGNNINNMTNFSHSSSHHHHHHHQQPVDYLPQLSSSNLNSVSLDAYNSPQFKAMLEQIMKPMSVPVEETTLPGDWPSVEKISMLSEPIYIPAPLPIVIPAPNMLKQMELPAEFSKSLISHYPKTSVPSIASDQAHYHDFGIRQINIG